MKRRLLSCLFAAMLLISCFSIMIPSAKAQSEFHASEKIINMIKNFEGFSGACYLDGLQRSVGYGTRCDVCDTSAAGYPQSGSCSAYTSANPISVEHATELLTQFVEGFEKSLNQFISKNKLTLTQNQFDALLCLNYNTGGGWMYDTTSPLRDAVLKGDMGEYIVYAFGTEAKFERKHVVGLIRRRMVEAEVYLHGNYGSVFDWPENLRYVLLDAAGGKLRYSYQTFDATEICPIRAEFTSVPQDAEGNDLTFAGWFTQPEGGVEVENLTYAQSNGMVLYAHWKNAAGEIVQVETDTSTAVDVKVVVPQWWPDELYEGPGKFYAEVRGTTLNEQLHITKVVTGIDGERWGYCADGWIPLSSTNYDDVIASTQTEGLWYKVVTPSGVKVRTEPSTKNSDNVVGHKANGAQVLIVQTQENTEDDQTWGQLSDGNWICIRNGQESAYAVVMDPQPETAAPTPATPVTITKIEIASKPAVLDYLVGGLDVLPDLTGAQVTIYYDNGRKETQDITRWMVSGFDNSKIGTNTITVTCGGKTATFDVNIIPEVIVGISVNTMPTKTDYLYKTDDLDLTGASLLVTYEMNYTRVIPITADMVTGFDNAVPGVNTLTVSFEGFTTTFDVNIFELVVTFLNYDGSIISQTAYPMGAQVVIPPDPVRPEDAQGEYVFAGWDKEVVPCSGSATYTATYTLCHTVTFLDYDGTVLSSQKYTPGAAVTAPAAPSRPADDKGEYLFAGWDKEVVSCNGKATYTATYTLCHTVTFLDYDGTVLSSQKYTPGAAVTAPAAPSRPADDKGEYLFAGWDKEVVPCNGKATYTATYTLCHTITFLNYDGSVISAQQYTPGAAVTAPEVPGKPADAYGEYVFDGWDREVVACNGKATYTATYRLRYALGDLDRNGQVDENDGIYLLWYVFFPEEYPIYGWADFDGNNVVNENDGIYLLWHVFFPAEYPLD